MVISDHQIINDSVQFEKFIIFTNIFTLPILDNLKINTTIYLFVILLKNLKQDFSSIL